jgi:hypothetical protein
MTHHPSFVLILAVAFALVLTSPGRVAAQDVPPPPPPTESQPNAQSDASEQDAEEVEDLGIVIDEPKNGAEVGVAFVIRGRAGLASEVEVYVDDQLEQRMRVDDTGAFRVAVAGFEPSQRLRIRAVEIAPSGEPRGDTSVLVTTKVQAPGGNLQPAAPAAPAGAPADTTTEHTPANTPEEPGPLATEPSLPESGDDSVVEGTRPPDPPPFGQTARGALVGLGALGGATLGGALGVVGAGLFLLAFPPQNDGFAGLGILALGGVFGYAVGMPLGAWTTGYLLDGNGNIWLTALGAFAGIAAGASFFDFTGIDIDPFVGFAVVTALGAAGAGIAYELTSAPSRRAAEYEKNLRFSVAPVPGGGMAGLSYRW